MLAESPVANKSLKRNAFWNILSNGVNLLLLFVLTPIITKGLGDTGYGIYVILGTIGGALNIANLGLGEATLRFVAFYYARQDENGINRVFNATLWLYSILGISISLLFILYPQSLIDLLNLNALGDEGNFLIRLTIVLFLINFIYACFTSVFQALQRYDIYSYVSTGQNGLRFISNILIIFLGYGLKGLVIVNLAIGGLFLCISIIETKRLLPYLSLYRIPSFSDYKEIFSYGIYAFISQIVGLVWQYCDNILLAIYIGPQSVGFFSIPMQLIGKVNGLITAGFSVLFPKFASEEQDSQIKSLYIKSTQLSLFLSILLFVPISIMLKDFLHLWISAEFAQKAGFIATLLAFSYIIRGAFLPYESLLKGIGKPNIIMYITIASSAVILITDMTLLPRVGLNGVGFAYLISSGIGIAAITYVWKKFVRFPEKLAYRKFFLPYMISLISFGLLFLLKIQLAEYIQLSFISFLLTGTVIFTINAVITITAIYYLSDKQFIREIYHSTLHKLQNKCLLKRR